MEQPMSVKILLADDHQLVRQGLRSMLDEQPNLHVIGEADSGRTAMRLARELSPDIVIMDVTMPDLNGIEATRQIRGENPNVRVIALSMHRDRQFILELFAASGSGYLPKDSPIEDLVTAIEAVMRGEIYLSPKLTGTLVSECIGGVPESGAFCGTLTPREREILQLVAEGKNAKEIANMLHISSKTVEGHRRQVMEKLKLYSVAELTRFAIREGVTTPP
jgi:DNA-binding NarL/FixJ family response regulator